MTTEGLERRMTKVENEILAIYDDINDFRRDTTSRFDAVDARFDTVDARFDAVDARFDAVDARFDAVDARLNAVEVGITEVLRRLPDDPRGVRS